VDSLRAKYHLYQSTAERTDWDTARLVCLDMGLDLVTIPLQIVQEALYAGVKPVITAPW
jgi:hypothetical protein